MAFRHTLPPPSSLPNPYPPAYSNPPAPISTTSLSGAAPSQMAPADPASPSLSNKRQRANDNSAIPPPQGVADTFIQDHDAADSGADDDEDDDKPKDKDKRVGRRKIKIEFIQDKSRRHITFSKRKAGIMKKAYELSTLTGTQVLLLVVSETGLVYTFTTAKLQPLVTQPEGKNLIQACLNAPHGQLPSSMPVGTPIGRSANPMNMGGGPPNVPGGLSISGGSKDEDADADAGDEGDSGNERGGAPGATATATSGERPAKRRRASSSAANNNGTTPLTRSQAAAQQQQQQTQSSQQQGGQQQQTSPTGTSAPGQMSPPHPGQTSPSSARGAMSLPIPQSTSAPSAPSGILQQQQQSPTSPLDVHTRGPPPPSPSSHSSYAGYPGGHGEVGAYPGAPPPPPQAYGAGPPPPTGPYGYPTQAHDPQAVAAAQAQAQAAAQAQAQAQGMVQQGMQQVQQGAWGSQPSGVPGYGRR